ncbi:hypothetical protein RclHR1_01490020 [Rhizophagus clarus]|uniref:F-box domain-containing protein n=1 Tax=Rhizophagus clarus TaxID=94130 RepID=A0A2Z6QR93_9GLOM|nr:hypothetical protein RclHR1_01490020 [Rhizophagus clarus]GES73358.1 hypothetical protein GLOIN_2v1649613 [Rhizophagus clarus]
MSELILDILVLIIEDLEDDYSTLFNCLLVNKIWCKTTVPILWKNFLNYAFFKFKYVSLIKIFSLYLSEESKILLTENGIDFHLPFISKKPLFNYISFLKSIVIFDISKVFEVCFYTKLVENQKEIIENIFYNIIFNQCSSIKCLDLSHEFYEKKYEMVNYIELKDQLSNLVEFTCTQYIDEKIFYTLAEICVNIRKLEIRKRNKNNDGLFKLIQAQKQLEYFCYRGRKSRTCDWDIFCKEMGEALIKHANTLKHFNTPIRLCIPLITLNSFVNLETLMLGYSTNYINDLHLIKLPKLQYLKVCYLTKVRELIQNTGGFLKRIEIYKPLVEAEEIIKIIRVVYQHCPQLEYFCFPFVDKVGDILEELLLNCNYLKKIIMNGYYLDGDILLRILIKSTSKKLQHIEINGDWKFSVKELEGFLNNWKERKCLLYLKFDLNSHCPKKEFSNIFHKFIDDGVLDCNSCIFNN